MRNFSPPLRHLPGHGRRRRHRRRRVPRGADPRHRRDRHRPPLHGEGGRGARAPCRSASTIYWADGTPDGNQLGLEDREPVTSIEEVPQPVSDAVIATEDQSFWTNDGIDLGAVFRAFLTNVMSGEIEQGGSTITQQLVKNRILTPKRDVNRKIKEIEDALRLNEKFSKEKILEEYLNTVYFGSELLRHQGGGASGSSSRLRERLPVRAARARRSTELTIGEAALLAGLISNPEGNNPFTYPDRADPAPGRRAARRGRAGVHHAGRGRRRQQRAAPDRQRRRRSTAPEQLPRRRGPGPAPQDDPRSATRAKERRDKLLKGGLEGLHDVRSAAAGDRARTPPTNRQAGRPGRRLGVVAGRDRPGTGAVQGNGRRPRLRRHQYQHRDHRPAGARPVPRGR